MKEENNSVRHTFGTKKCNDRENKTIIVKFSNTSMENFHEKNYQSSNLFFDVQKIALEVQILIECKWTKQDIVHFVVQIK